MKKIVHHETKRRFGVLLQTLDEQRQQLNEQKMKVVEQSQKIVDQTQNIDEQAQKVVYQVITYSVKIKTMLHLK